MEEEIKIGDIVIYYKKQRGSLSVTVITEEMGPLATKTIKLLAEKNSITKS